MLYRLKWLIDIYTKVPSIYRDIMSYYGRQYSESDTEWSDRSMELSERDAHDISQPAHDSDSDSPRKRLGIGLGMNGWRQAAARLASSSSESDRSSEGDEPVDLGLSGWRQNDDGTWGIGGLSSSSEESDVGDFVRSIEPGYCRVGLGVWQDREYEPLTYHSQDDTDDCLPDLFDGISWEAEDEVFLPEESKFKKFVKRIIRSLFPSKRRTGLEDLEV